MDVSMELDGCGRLVCVLLWVFFYLFSSASALSAASFILAISDIISGRRGRSATFSPVSSHAHLISCRLEFAQVPAGSSLMRGRDDTANCVATTGLKMRKTPDDERSLWMSVNTCDS